MTMVSIIHLQIRSGGAASTSIPSESHLPYFPKETWLPPMISAIPLLNVLQHITALKYLFLFPSFVTECSHLKTTS